MSLQTNQFRTDRGRSVCRLLAVLLLVLIGVQRYAAGRKSPSVEGYDRRIRESAARVPLRVDGWVGVDVPVPRREVATLRPNVMISRRYLNVENGAAAGLLLVHCANAHHMVGHFPLRCYPADGWSLRGSRARDWNVGGMRIGGTEYEFTMQALGLGTRSLVVENFLLRPGGRVLRDMAGMAGTLSGGDGPATGAGQCQIYFDAAVPPAQREAAVAALVGACRPVLDAILADPR